jgi:hypothetical protein
MSIIKYPTLVSNGNETINYIKYKIIYNLKVFISLNAFKSFKIAN